MSLYTGLPDIGVPLGEISSSTGLSVPIALRYHAAGVRVADVASWVGLGWSLSAGGAVTRSVRGLPDDELNGYLGTWEKVGEVYNDVRALRPGERGGDANFLEAVRNGLRDSQPDEFSFNVGGLSGTFSLGPPPSGVRCPVARLHSLEPIEIDFAANDNDNDQQTCGVGIESWTLTGPDGTKYTFADPERTETWSTRADEVRVNPSWLFNPESTKKRLRYYSAWYLSKIESPTGGAIDFLYDRPQGPMFDRKSKDDQPPAGFVLRSITSSDEVEASACESSSTGPSFAGPITSFSSGEGSNISYSRTISASAVYPVYLASITSDLGRAVFTSEGNRRDVTDYHEERPASGAYGSVDERRLASVQISRGAHDRTFTLDHEYFNDDPDSDEAPENLRLRLDAVRETGHDGSELPPTTFSYDESELPSRYSYSVDHWGYYNGKDNSTMRGQTVAPGFSGSNGGDRSPSPSVVKAGSLKSITHPTGGRTEFDFEPNDFRWVASVTGTPASVPVHTFIDTESYTAVQTGSGATRCDFNIAPETAVQKPMTGEWIYPVDVSLYFCDPHASGPDSGGGTASKCSPFDSRVDSNPSCYAVEPPEREFTQNAGYVIGGPTSTVFHALDAPANPPSSVRNEVHHDLPQSRQLEHSLTAVVVGNDDRQAVVSVTFEGRITLAEAVSRGLISYEHVTGGGLRVARVRAIDPQSQDTLITSYSYLDPSGPAASSGVLVSDPAYASVVYYEGRNSGGGPASCLVSRHASFSIFESGTTRGASVGYGAVRVSRGDGQGSVLHTFRTARDAPDSFEDARGWSSVLGSRTSHDWQRGQEESRVVYNASGEALHETENRFSFLRDSGYPASPAILLWPQIIVPNSDQWSYGLGLYDVVRGWARLDETVQTVTEAP